MKTSVNFFVLMLTVIVFTMSGCALDEDIDIPGGNDDAITKYLGNWSVTDNGMKLNYEVTIERSQTNSSMVIIRNFAGSGSSADGLVVSNSVIVEEQVTGNNWIVSGTGDYKNNSRIDFQYTLTIGGQSEVRQAIFTR